MPATGDAVDRSLVQFFPVLGDVGTALCRFVSVPSLWLPGARRIGGNRWWLNGEQGPLNGAVEFAIGDPWRSGASWWRAWSWYLVGADRGLAGSDRRVPVLDAELGLAVVSPGAATLVVDGRYVRPGDTDDRAVDAVEVRRVIRRMVDEMLCAVAQALTRPEATRPEAITRAGGQDGGRWRW